MGATPQQTLSDLYRSQYSSLVAPLIRILGSFEHAEDVVQDAFAKALDVWSRDGLPDVPIAWLRRTARNQAIDRYRRQARWNAKSEELIAQAEIALATSPQEADVADDALRLIFTCCHPSLSPAAQIALTLRTVCGLTTEEVARAMLLKPATLQQRLVRAKRKIDVAKIPYIVPDLDALPGRLGTVLETIYLVFTEGYGATKGEALIRHELCEEAIRLARLLLSLIPSQTPPRALLALMLLHHSRRQARTSDAGDLITLENQDRSLWDQELISEALPMVELCLAAGPATNYAIEAAISALHATAINADETDWAQIHALYRLLLRTSANPVIELNAAVALAMTGEVEAALEQIRALETRNSLPAYHLLHAAKADLLGRLGRITEAIDAYDAALAAVSNGVEKRYLQSRRAALQTKS